MFRICAAGAAVLTAAQAFVSSLAPLLVLRLLAGAFMAGIMPTAYSAASRHSSADQRGGAYGFTFSSVILARALGLLAGGWLAAAAGLASLFVIGGALMAVAAVMARMGGNLGEKPAASS